MTLERNSGGGANISNDPDVLMTPDTLDSPTADSMVTPRTDSKHDCVCDSPVAPGEKATDPYVNPRRSLALLFQLERRADMHICIQEEARHPYAIRDETIFPHFN